MRNDIVGLFTTLIIIVFAFGLLTDSFASLDLSTTTTTVYQVASVGWLSESNTTLTIVYDPTIDDSPLIQYFNISMGDQFGNTYYLTPTLIFTTQGEDLIDDSAPELGTYLWTEYSYALMRGGVGSGNFGDAVAFFQLWDATNSTIRQGTIYEFSRSGWGSYDIRYNGTLTHHLNGLFPTYTPPAQGFIEGIVFPNGTHTP